MMFPKRDSFVLFLIYLVAISSPSSASGEGMITVTCQQENAFDKGYNCGWRRTGDRCCCWCPDPTGAHSHGHVMDMGRVVRDADVYFEIKPGAGDISCRTKGYMYYSLDGSSWTRFWSKSDLRGWTKYSDTAHIADSFRYIRANTDGCSVDWCKIEIGGTGRKGFDKEPGRAGVIPRQPAAKGQKPYGDGPAEVKPRRLTKEEKARRQAAGEARRETSKRAAEKANKMEREKAEADRAKEQMRNAKTQADSEQASRYAKESYAEAQQKEQTGNEKYEEQDYVAAARLHQEATNLYRKSVEEAQKTGALPSELVWRNGKIISVKDGAEMVLIPEGGFIMGSPPEEGEYDEHPEHRVYIDAFYLDKSEVTIGQYKKFLQATGNGPLPDWGYEDTRRDRYPIIGVSWQDAVAYAAWAGKRLPTEAEWEYACRAGTTTKYNVGDSIGHNDANYVGTEGKDRWERTAPVGSFPPNAWDLCDMHGNVWEWCADWYDKGYYKKSPIYNPKGPNRGEFRVVRGGSWDGHVNDIRSAHRNSLSAPESTSSPLGFRCARDLE